MLFNKERYLSAKEVLLAEEMQHVSLALNLLQKEATQVNDTGLLLRERAL